VSGPVAEYRVLRWRGLWLACGWLLVLLIIYLSLRPGGPVLPPSISDKLQHVVAYGVLTYWFTCLYLNPPARAAYATGFVLLGVALEFVQAWTGYRSFDFIDMAADALGVALGWLVAPPQLPSLPVAFERWVSGAGYNRH
jgi:VanZ family protein